MDKPEKGTSSKNPKEKTSFLGNNIIESRESPDDEDIGKDFLSSWKAVTVNEDAMDFSFSMDSSTKNKKFDFDKLDMDFGLDGDFDKLSSFKVDMSDFNLSAPTKKATGPKEILEDESSTVKSQGKRSQFNFSFDFNELDNFNFESSLAREEKVSCKNKGDQMKVSFDDTEQKSSKIRLSEDASAVDDTIATKLLPASKGVATLNVETLLSGPGYPDAIKLDCAMYVSSGAPNSPSNFRSSPEEAINTTAEATNHQCHMSEKAIAIDMYTQPAPFEYPDQSLVGVDSNGNSLSNGQTRTTYQATGVNVTSSRKKDVNEKNAGFSSCKETLPVKNSSPPNIIVSGSNTEGKNKSDTEITTETVLDNESAINELDIAGNSSGSLSCKASHDSRDNKEKQNFATVLPADPYSEPIAGKLTITNKKEAGAHKLEFSKKEGSALEAKSLSLGSEQTNIIHKSSTNETGISFNYADSQHGINSGGNPLPAARELTKGEDTLLMGAKNLKHPCNIGNFQIMEGFTSDGLPNLSTLDRNSCLNGVEVKNTRPISVMSTSENTVKVQNTTRLEPVRMSKIKSVEWNKLSLVRSPKKIFDQSNLNNSMTRGAGKASDCTPQKGINFQQNQDNDVEVQDNAASEIANPHKATKNQMPQSFSLKRKAFELPNSDLACLKPLKRLSSPSESREPAKQIVEEKLSRVEKILKPLSKLSKAPDSNLNEPLKRVDIKESMRKIGEEKVFCHQEESNVKRILFSVPASKIGSPPEATVMDLELSLTIETDGNVEKAEAFAKELEDICIMLRKKHEEAKEILVRALVNNNNLLMLNHPIYEEKICKVQKFAAELMSKALNT